MQIEPFSEAELTFDRFLDGRVMIAQPRHGYRAAMDPVLLAAACPAVPGQSVLELGCGAGVASLCLGRRVGNLRQVGLEVQHGYAELARRNAKTNQLDLMVMEGDLARMPSQLRGRSFDHVIANPPYFATGGGTVAADSGREHAQREDTPLAHWISAAYRRLVPGGWLTVVQQADRLGDVIENMSLSGGAITILPIAPRVDRAATRIIVRARKGAKTRLRLLAPFVLHAEVSHLRDGEDVTPLARRILRDGEALPFA